MPNINWTQLWRRSLTFAVSPNSIAKFGLVYIHLGETHTLACIPKQIWLHKPRTKRIPIRRYFLSAYSFRLLQLKTMELEASIAHLQPSSPVTFAEPFFIPRPALLHNSFWWFSVLFIVLWRSTFPASRDKPPQKACQYFNTTHNE